MDDKGLENEGLVRVLLAGCAELLLLLPFLLTPPPAFLSVALVPAVAAEAVGFDLVTPPGVAALALAVIAAVLPCDNCATAAEASVDSAPLSTESLPDKES